MRCPCGCEFEPGSTGRPTAGARGAPAYPCPQCGKPVAVPSLESGSVTELEPISSGTATGPVPGPRLAAGAGHETEVPIVEDDGADSMSAKPIGELEELSGLGWKIGSTVLDRFQIREIRAGGMGVVYIAWDQLLQRDVAIKSLQKRCLERSGSVERFFKECILWIRLTERHPNIVQAYFARRHGDYPLLFLEFVDGKSLRARMRDARLAFDVVMDFAMQVAFGLLYAWERHYVVHRDIKPENILITREGIAKITDFGLATVNVEALKLVAQAGASGTGTHKRPGAERGREASDAYPGAAVNPATVAGLHGASRLTQAGEIVGTIPYMSPEQIAGDRVLDTRSDIYSFGLTLYEMLTHRHPFYGSTLSGLPTAILFNQPPPPSEVSASFRALPIANDLDRLVMRCLEKDPDRRYADFDDLLTDLERLGHALGVEPHFEIDKRFMLIGPKEWQEKIASLRELGAEQEAKEAEEESAFQAALGLDDARARTPVVTRGERSNRPKFEKTTLLRTLGSRQLLLVLDGGVTAYEPDLLIRQLELNGWFSEKSPVWNKELQACEGYVVRIQRSGGVDRMLEARTTLIEGCASEAMLLNQPRALADLPAFYAARQWNELTVEEELGRLRTALSTAVQTLGPDERLLLRDFDYVVGKVKLSSYREAVVTETTDYASGTVDLELTIRAGASYSTLREHWEEVVLPAFRTGKVREAWKALGKSFMSLRAYRRDAGGGEHPAVVNDLLHSMAAYLRILESLPPLRDFSRPFPHLDLKLRKGADPTGRPLSAEVTPWLEPYLYGFGGVALESLPLPIQSGKLAAWEKWSGTVTLPITIVAVRIAGKRTEARRLRVPDSDDPDGGEAADGTT